MSSQGEFRHAVEEERLITAIRLALAASTLAIVWLDPSRPAEFVALTYSILILYVAFSLSLHLLARRDVVSTPWAPWIDVAFVTVLVGLSGGADSIFFFGFLFPVAASAFSHGFKAGFRVAVASALLFGGVALAVPASEAEFPVNRMLLRFSYLLLLGFMIAHWGGRDILFKRRLALLGSLAAMANPRLGLDAALDRILRKLSSFFNAKECLLVYSHHESRARALRDCAAKERAGRDGEAVGPAILESVCAIPDSLAAGYNGKPGWRSRRYWAREAHTGKVFTEGEPECRRAARLLDSDSLVTAPLRLSSGFRGRLVMTRDGWPFDATESEFLVSALTQLSPALDHIHLVDRLAGSVAEEERRRIARDLHDSVIQTVVGMRLGLEALRETARRNSLEETVKGVDRLVSTADAAIYGLRSYVSGLREPLRKSEDLERALRRYAEKLSELTGIKVQVDCRGDENVGDRLAGEVFQMAVEALNNIRKHTDAGQASVRVEHDAENVRLEVRNPSRSDEFQAFRPLTISERAAALGGEAKVFLDSGRETVVRIDIPL